MLQTQLDLTHSEEYTDLIQELIERKEGTIARFEKMIAKPEGSVEALITASTLTQSLTARRWGNAKKLSGRTELVQRIKTIAASFHTPHRSDLSSHLLSCLPPPSDPPAPVSPWFRLLSTLESIDHSSSPPHPPTPSDSDIKTAVFTLENAQNRLQKISDDDKLDLDSLDLMEMLEEITRAYRLLVKKVENPCVLSGFDSLWLVNCAIFDLFVSVNAQKVAKVYSEIQRQVDKEKSRLKFSLQTMSDQWQSRLDEEKRQKSKALQIIDRLQLEKTSILELLKDREAEISEIRHPDDMRDFENVVGVLGQYLEDMEARHEAQSVLLDSIGDLINMRNLKKHGKRKDELGYSIIKQALTGGRSEFAFGIKNKGKGDGAQEATGRSRASSLPHSLARRRSSTTTKGPPLPQAHQSYRPPIATIPEAPITITGDNKCDPEQDTSTDSEETTDDIGVQTDPWQPSQSPRTIIQPLPKRAKILPKRTGLLSLLDDQMRKQPPMLNSNVFKLFEIAMLEKLKSDISEEEQGRMPKSMADFMLDFLFMQQGLKTLVVKSLGALLNALEGLASKKHPYGTLFCRVLNVFVDKPFDGQLNSFLVKARAEFCELQKGYKTVGSKAEAEVGGSAQLVDISEKLIGLFPMHRTIAYEVVERLDLGSVTEFDKSCIVFCGRLHKIGRDFKIFFIQADPQKTGLLDESSFITTAQDTFDICLSRPRLLEIFHFLTPSKLHYSDIQKLPFKEWVAKGQSKLAAVTKCGFLTTIAEVYWSQEEQLTDKLKRTYERMKRDGVANLLDFQELVEEVEEEVPPEAVVQMYRETLDVSAGNSENQDLVTKEAFCEVGLKYHLGCDTLRAFTSGLSPLQYALNLQSTRTPFIEDPESP